MEAIMAKKKLMITQFETLALLIERTRLYRGITKEELSRLAGVSTKTIKRYEDGQIDLGTEQFKSVMRTLGLLKTTTVWEALGIDISEYNMY
jgi:predicted transcriptional regulator